MLKVLRSRPASYWAGMVAVIAAGVVRLWVWALWSESEMILPDSAQYLKLSVEYPSAYQRGELLSFRRPPVYPAFLSLFNSVKMAVLAQAALGTAVVIVVWRWGRSVVSETAGCVAAWVVALDPPSVFFGTYALTETLFTLLILGAVASGWQASVRRSAWLGIAAGVFCALAALTRPIAMFLPLALALMMWLALHRTLPAVALLSTSILLMGIWVVRNTSMEDLPALSTIEGASLLYWRGAGAVSAAERRPVREVRRELETLIESQRFVTLGDRYRAERSLGLRLILKYPGGYAAASVEPVARMFFGIQTPDFRRTFGIEPPSHAVVVSILLLVYFAAGAGGVHLWRRGQKELVLLVVVTAVYLIGLSLGPESYARFRVPWWPLVAVLAGSGIGKNHDIE